MQLVSNLNVGLIFLRLDRWFEFNTVFAPDNHYIHVNVIICYIKLLLLYYILIYFICVLMYYSFVNVRNIKLTII